MQSLDTGIAARESHADVGVDNRLQRFARLNENAHIHSANGRRLDNSSSFG